MSDFCDAIDNWGELSAEDRYEQIAEWAQEWAEEWGIEPPDVENQNPPYNNAGESAAGYDPASNTLYLGPDLFGGDFSPDEVLGETAHELRHAMQWQYYGEDTPYEMPRVPREADAQDFGDAMRDMVKDTCGEPDYFDSAPPIAEGGGGDGGGAEWSLPAEEDADA